MKSILLTASIIFSISCNSDVDSYDIDVLSGSDSDYTLETLREMNSICIEEMITSYSIAGCETIYRAGREDELNTFSCLAFNKMNDDVGSSYTSYSTETLPEDADEYEGSEPFCSDDNQVVYKSLVFTHDR